MTDHTNLEDGVAVNLFHWDELVLSVIHPVLSLQKQGVLLSNQSLASVVSVVLLNASCTSTIVQFKSCCRSFLVFVVCDYFVKFKTKVVPPTSPP